MTVVGLDLSLVRTGVATIEGTTTLHAVNKGMARLATIRDEVLRICERADLVVIEGYSFGTSRQQSHAHALGELGGVVRLALWEARVPYADCPPAVLKRYACGKGNANKGQVLEAASRRSGLDFGGDDNRADAYFLRAMGLDHLGVAEVVMPALNRAALASVTWPKLPAPAVAP